MLLPKLPKVSPTVQHWVTLVATAFAGAVMADVAQDGGPIQVFSDLTDASKRGPIIAGFIVAGLGAVWALVQRSVLPNVTANAHAENVETAAVKSMAAVRVAESFSRQTAETPVDAGPLAKEAKAMPSSFPKGGQ
jgi:hypothetical protein